MAFLFEDQLLNNQSKNEDRYLITTTKKKKRLKNAIKATTYLKYYLY